MNGGDRHFANGDISPIAVTYYTSRNYNRLRHYQHGMIWEGVQDGEEASLICEVSGPKTFVLRENSEGITEYFIGGRNSYYEGPHVNEEIHFTLCTSYNRPFDEPDSMVIGFVPAELEGEDTIGIANHAVVEDLEADGLLDWVQPYWQFDRSDSTYFIHVPIYDPDSLVMRREYTELVSDIYYRGPDDPRPIRGVFAVDTDDDNVLELLLVMQGRPLRIIDSQRMEIIMSSEFVVPDEYSYLCEFGRFDSTGRLQLVIQDGDDLVAYNMPEEWTYPNSVESRTNPLLPMTICLIPAYPNPFNAVTRLNYSLPDAGLVNIRVYDVSGHLIETLVSSNMVAGYHSEVWDAGAVSSGLYLVKMKAKGFIKVQKIVLTK